MVFFGMAPKAHKLKVVEPVAAAPAERDAVMDFELAGVAAADAHLVTRAHDLA
jgi:hypothetical protein